jgi:small subunit ribosomal protein S20
VANTKSARRMIRVAERRRQRNRAIKSAVRTYIKKAEQAIQADVQACHEQVIAAIRALDRAVTKGVLHRNNAARRKSRLMKKYNRAKAAATAAAS